MRTTVDLNEKMVVDAMSATGIKKKTELLEAGIQALISREAAKRLAKMWGSIPNFKPGRRLRGIQI